jgi:hypothetical protein
MHKNDKPGFILLTDLRMTEDARGG